MGSILGSYDPHWGALVTTLQAEGLQPGEIEKAKEKLSSVAKNREIPIDEEVQALYAKVFPPNRDELILGIKGEILKYTEQAIREVLEGDPYAARAKFTEAKSYIEGQLRALRQLGDIELTRRVFLRGPTTSVGQPEEVAEEVFGDYGIGAPTSFPMTAHLLTYREIGCFDITNPPSRSNSMQTLRRLAKLGERVALSCLSVIYEKGKIGDKKVELSIDDRLEGLRELALVGHGESQEKLASACVWNKLGNDKNLSLTEERRRGYIEKLFEHEVPHSLHLKSITAENKIGDLPLTLSVEERLGKLHERAQKGEWSSFVTLFEAYLYNRLGEEKLQLPYAERVKKFMQLKQVNESFYNAQLAKIYRDNGAYGADTLKFNLTDANRLQWLEEQALKHRNYIAQSIMIEAYRTNHLGKKDKEGSIKLKISFKERVEKLRVLADLGHLGAQKVLVELYQSYLENEEQEVVENASQEIIPYTEEVIREDVLRWSLLSSYCSKLHTFVTSEIDSEQEKTLTFLFSVRGKIQSLCD